jgi:protein O-GlcNAc transferase
MSPPDVGSKIKAAMDLHRAGRSVEAERLYRKVLAKDPRRADVAFLLGLLALESGKLEAAADMFGRAATLDPGKAAYHANLGEAQRRLRRFDAAKESFLRATVLAPELAAPAYNFGLLLQDMGDTEAAIVWYRRALDLDPGLTQAYCNLGNALWEVRRDDEAVTAYRAALELDSGLSRVHNNLANALARTGLVTEALASYRTALAIAPDYAVCHSNLVYHLHFHGGYDAAAILSEARAWDREHARPLAPKGASHHTNRTRDRRLRIGYVSPDFRQHCQAYFMFPLLSRHDHEQFEIFCYSDVLRPDDWTRRLLGYADHSLSILEMHDGQVAARIRDDRIDILVDLTMHMDRNRLGVFARKAAPVQVCWLAYPGTTGLSTMDYRLTDPFLDPPESDQSVYAEQPLRLPETFWCYHPLTSEDRVSPLPALANGHIRFGSLNNFCKVSDDVIDLWAKVLQAVPGSRLVILVPEGEARGRTLGAFAKRAIQPQRIDLVGFQKRLPYLATYRTIDIGLDTFPYNGHTTSLDALWMGVPVVTLVGTTVAGRAGLCQAMNLGLPELVARTSEEFVAIAVGLATDTTKLAQLREGLRERIEKSPLMDADRFVRNLEAAYREAWSGYCEGGRLRAG